MGFLKSIFSHNAPKSVAEHCTEGASYLEKNRLKLAIREYLSALDLDPNCVEAHLKLAHIYHQQYKLDEAIQEFKEVIRLDRNNLDTHLRLAGLYLIKLTSGSKQDAAVYTTSILEETNEMLRIDKGSATANYFIGVVHVKNNRINEAIAAFQTTVNFNPRYKAAHAELGTLYKIQGQLDKAVQEYETVLEIDPNDAIVHAILWKIYYARGDAKKAEKHLEAVKRLGDDRVGAIFSLELVQESP